jgi:hypothetical protein
MKLMRAALAAGAAACVWVSPTVASEKVDPMTFVPDLASVKMPELAFTASPETEADFDKYYYFHREGTSFSEALADLRDCDGFASGLSSGYTYQAAPYPYTYTMAGAAGGVIGNAMVAAIFGSAEKRRIRRFNMRRCMNFKGYDRYGIEKGLWQEFNFEEGFSGEEEEVRQAKLAQQALVASGAKPSAKALGL